MSTSFATPSVFAITLALGVVAAAPASAQSALPTGVGVYLDNTMPSVGGSSYASSNSVTIYSSGGLEVHTPYSATYGVTSAPTMPLNLTSATLSSSGTNVPVYGGHGAGTATASADLATGILRGTTGSTADIPWQGIAPQGLRVETTSFMRDSLTFSTPSAAGAEVTVSAHLDGSFGISDPYYGAGTQSLVLNLGGSFGYYGGSNASGTVYGYHGAVIGDFDTYSFTNETPTGFDFTGTFHVTDGEVVPFSMGLYLDCGDASCDFGHTARIGLTVTDGASYTSGSGVFLTGTGTGGGVATAVPEPESWALMLGGLAAIGGVARRRRADGRRAAA